MNTMTWRRGALATLASAAVLVVSGLTLSAHAGATRATATLLDPVGTTVGTVRMNTQTDGHVLVRVSVTGLPAGFHGFHIHTVGTCTAPDFVSAGGHFNPGGATHPSHAGDQPVILVNADGTGILRFETDRYAVADLFDADGSAFIVHAGADNYANIPTRYASSTPVSPGALGPDATTLATGDAGARSACGLIRQ